ncbi:competence protein CoiA [Streptomyces diastaticus]|uniref:competence protein CoiA n=1 Tax=Streptomyces diastaticus TaxID=1956 RepID=UPI0035DECAF2
MLIALAENGELVEAGEAPRRGEYLCPMCRSGVRLKQGPKISAHFAHIPGSDCPCSEPESWRHLLSKQVLVEKLRWCGWNARAEVVHPAAGRRIDVVAEAPFRGNAIGTFAIEVQDSAIQVDTMKERVAADRKLGYDTTVWLFTNHRAARLMMAGPRDEVRVHDEMLWVDNRYRKGVSVIDPVLRTITIVTFKTVLREQDPEYATTTWRSLRKTKRVERRPGDFFPKATAGRFGDRHTVSLDRLR